MIPTLFRNFNVSIVLFLVESTLISQFRIFACFILALLFGRGRHPDYRWPDSTLDDNYWLLHKLLLFSAGLDTAPLESQLYNFLNK